jgi:DNA repair protein RadC
MAITPTQNSIAYDDTFIREVRATYHRTDTPTTAISGPESAAAFIRSILPDNSREHFVALYLDSSHQVACYSIVAIGLTNQCLVHPREVFQRAILSGATAMIVAHNHPSGNLAPSKEDVKLTARLKTAGELLGIPLLDHLVLSDTAYESIINTQGISDWSETSQSPAT